MVGGPLRGFIGRFAAAFFDRSSCERAAFHREIERLMAQACNVLDYAGMEAAVPGL
jgi:hypothetical protein